MKKIITAKIIIMITLTALFFTIVIAIVSAITGASIGYNIAYNDSNIIIGSSSVINNQLYAGRYKTILNKYLTEKGYVSLERLVFYLQRTNNILDVTKLSNEVWETAYLANLNEKEKQMVPIKTLCKELKQNETIPEYTITDDVNESGVYINALNLCVVNDIDITQSDDYTENYSYLPYVFPLKDKFSVTSIVFENRNLDLNLPEDALDKTNYHSGWDFAVPIGTDFYSVCEGTIKNIVNTQFNDLPYNQSGNSTGNFIEVSCINGLTAQYFHIKPTLESLGLRVGNIVKEGQVLGKTSTTGLSTGPHLHLGLKNTSGKMLDSLEYIDFDYKK